MREPTQDANSGAIMQVAPTKKHAARTVTIAQQNNNAGLEKMKQANQIGSALGGAIGRFVDREHDSEMERRYMEAYHGEGTDQGLAEFSKDQRRTGFTDWIYNGQSPEYQGQLHAEAESTAASMYVRESEFIEDEGADLTIEKYRNRQKKIIEQFVKTEMKGAPDAAMAFMRQWQQHSNVLSKQHAKASEVRKHQRARKTFKDGFHQQLSVIKQLARNEPDIAREKLTSLYEYKAIKGGISPSAWRTAVVEETIVAMTAGDTSMIPYFKGSTVYKDMGIEEIRAFNTAATRLDTSNGQKLSSAESALELAIKSGSDVKQAFAAYDVEKQNVAIRDTGSELHLSQLGKSDVFRAEIYQTYVDRINSNKKAISDAQLKEIDLMEANHQFVRTNMEGDESLPEERGNNEQEHVTQLLTLANQPNISLDVQTKAVTLATKALGHANTIVQDTDTARETNITSNVNLIQAQVNLALSTAKQTGKPPKLPKGVDTHLASMLDKTTDPNTKTQILNTMNNISQTFYNDGKDYIKAVTAEEVDLLQGVAVQADIGLAEIGGSSDLTPKQRLDAEKDYIEKTLKEIHDYNTENKVETKGGKEEVQKLLRTWQQKLAGYMTHADERYTREQEALRKQAEHRAAVDGYEAAMLNGKSTPPVTPTQRKEGADQTVVNMITNDGNKDATEEMRVDGVFSDMTSTRALMHNLDRLKGSIDHAPILKKGMDAAFRRLTTENADNPQEWSEENMVAMSVLQTAMQSDVLWTHLSEDMRNKAVYLIDAMGTGTDRSTAMAIANKPEESGFESPSKKEGWLGLELKLGIDNANEHLQARARGSYDYLMPKIGHNRAVAHVREIVAQQDISTDNLSIIHGGSYPPMKYKMKDTDGVDTEYTMTLKDFANDIENLVAKEWTQPVTGKIMLDVSSPANQFVHKILGNTKTKDGRFIRSLSEIPGGVKVTAIGDYLVFDSNVSAPVVIAPEVMNSLARSIHEMKLYKQRAAIEAKKRDPVSHIGTRGL